MPWRPQQPIRLLGDLERRVDEAFAELIHGPWQGVSATLAGRPAIDVHESRDEYFVLVDLPGVLPTEVHAYVENQTLIVHARRASHEWTKSGTMIYTERLQGEFVRRIALPGAVDPSKMQFSFAHGLLLIQLPKLPVKAIETTSGRHSNDA